ncbi:MAG TPA: alpha-ketoacid dehydrogenase subunit beta [Longimicrobiales bacterium]|nr:alpha-ketoacid dehydrogenase subunit beta [Longimicrobiales bacterium]
MKVTYLEAIRMALREELERDPDVFLIGEDIGVYGGAFKATRGLLEEFGPRRVMDTPISEAGFTGAAIGAAMTGLRPVVEFQFADFISCGFDQITNFAAKLHYRLGIPVPVVFRAPAGGGVHGGPFHSQSPEKYFTCTPGLKVVVPATAADARALLKAAIRDDNPVLVFEQKYLYRRVKEELNGDEVAQLGRAAVRRPGAGLTMATYGAMVHVCLEAAERLMEIGIDAEVVDLRSLVPLDEETLMTSVKKTNRLLVIHEDNRTGGYGAEVAARVADEAFVWLDAPIRRLTGFDTPVPFAPVLEDAWRPGPDRVFEAARELAAF